MAGEVGMHIHYVEDSKLDARALRQVLAKESDILLDVSEKLDDVGAAPSSVPIDVLLIDVVRPDSVSLETDISSARRFTQAPILFLTGLDPAAMRQRALAAGADAVLRKGNISGDMLRQFVENARARASLRDLRSASEEVDEPDVALLPVMAMDGPLAFVEHGLTRLLQRSGQTAWAGEMDGLQRYVETLRHVRRLGARDLLQRSDCDASTLVQGLESQLRAQAKQSGVKISFGYEENAWFTALGHAQDARAGIEALMQGLLGACDRQDRLHIEVHKQGDSACIEIACNRQILRGKQVFFDTWQSLRQDDVSQQASAYLQCAVAFLMLRAEQIHISADLGQRIFIDL